jgi:hypothetical protein
LGIKNGKVYRSKAAAYQVLVRPEIKKWDATGSVVIDRIPPLTAEFAYHGGEFPFRNDLTGAMDMAADIRGHFFDSAQQAEDKGWSQEEHDIVVKVLDGLCVKAPEYIWEYSAPKVEKPWPTYDDTHHKQIPTLAETLGLVAEALQYEQQNKNRGEVVERLTAMLEQPAEAEELTAA